MSKLTQISLDFGPEERPSASTGDNGTGNDPTRHYMAAGGVGVRVKSYKQTPASGGGDLFGEIASEAAPSAEVPVAVEAGKTTVPVEVIAEPVARYEPPATEQPQVTEAVEEAKEVAPKEVVVEEVVAEEVAAEDGPLPKRQVSAKTSGARQKGLPPQPPSKRGRKSLKQVSAEADLIEIPADEVLFSKQYYTMGEVSEMFRVNQSLLRFWESEFDVLQPRKNKKGDRYFRPVDIKNLHLIYHLLRQKKYTIEGAKEFLKKHKKADERFEVIKRLQEIKSFLLEMKAQL
jgi:DNA-binding transcriptional MerR regulator